MAYNLTMDRLFTKNALYVFLGVFIIAVLRNVIGLANSLYTFYRLRSTAFLSEVQPTFENRFPPSYLFPLITVIGAGFVA